MSWFFDVWISPTMRWSFFDSLVHPIAIYAQFVPNLLSGQKGKKKEILFPFCSTSAAYMFSSGRLLMASCFSLSMARVYFSMCFNPLCPRMLATVLMLLPLLRRFTAQEWRAQCQLICLSMPARFTHRFTDLQQLS